MDISEWTVEDETLGFLVKGTSEKWWSRISFSKAVEEMGNQHVQAGVHNSGANNRILRTCSLLSDQPYQLFLV